VHPAPISEMMKVRPTIIKEDKHQMQIKTILNHVQKFKSFGYGEARLLCSTVPPSLEVDVHERRNSWARCSVCELPASSYDRQPRRRFEFIPLWGIKVFLLYAPSELPALWREGRAYALGVRQATDHTQLRLVSGRVVKADELAGGG
jgi:hypothetical protein